MGNDQGRRHSRKKKRTRAKRSTPNEMCFVDYNDNEYVWENHVIGRVPFKEVEEVEIVFHNDKLWQENGETEIIHFLEFLLANGPRA